MTSQIRFEREIHTVMGTSMSDPLELGQRIVAVLDTGARTATYKLATLMALIEHCVENLPDNPTDELSVPIRDLAARVVELYWPQERTFESQRLRQSTQAIAKIPNAVRELRSATGVGDTGMSLAAAIRRAPQAYERTLGIVSLTLVRQPIHRLQKVPGGSGDPFLYDDSWMHDAVSFRTVALHGNAIVLFAGVGFGLARLAGLLRPTLEMLWVEDVRRMNKWLDADVPDVAGHLFGRDRISLAPARAALKEAFGGRCFYCATELRTDNQVDHVLPWSRVGIDGLANLVLACAACNGDKINALPSLVIVERMLQRDRVVLEQVAERISWPTQYDRVHAAARGIYRGEPAGSPTWDGYRRSKRLDLTFPPRWLSVEAALASDRARFVAE